MTQAKHNPVIQRGALLQEIEALLVGPGEGEE